MLEIGTKVAAPTLISIPSGTIHSRGRDSCSGLVFCLNDNVGWRCSLMSVVPISLGIWFYGVKKGDAGDD